MKVSVRNIAKHTLPSGILSWDVAPGGDCAFAGTMDGVYRVELNSGKHERIGEHRSYVSGVACIVGGGLLISAGYDGVLKWHDLAERKVIREVKAHDFWSWDLAVSPDGKLIASATGQYLAGGYEYEPAAEREPSVKLFRADDGSLVQALSMGPPVQAVAISPDSAFVAAANLMGEISVWEIARGKLAARWRTDAFTSWGVIKSHCYIGGIHALRFTSDGQHVIAAGMGPMRDPMAGNGKQLWQRFAWRESPPKKSGEIERRDAGEGLMEALAVHPSGRFFVMAGRLRGGQWNAAFFETDTGKLLHSLRTAYRVTEAIFYADGKRLVLAGLSGQPAGNESFGRWHAYEVELS